MLGHVEGSRSDRGHAPAGDPDHRVGGAAGRDAVSQYNAFLGRRIEEVATTTTRKPTIGSVCIRRGRVRLPGGARRRHRGHVARGSDGPAAMIMPADPQVGDVYRTENAPGFVFEEVTVRSTDETLDGPLGPIQGGMLADELHSDGKTEQKVFAPGYAGVLHGRRRRTWALALAVPRMQATEPLPAELTTMSSGHSRSSTWQARGIGRRRPRRVRAMEAAGRPTEPADVPRLIEPRMNERSRRSRVPFGPDGWPAPAPRRSRPLDRASTSSCRIGRSAESGPGAYGSVGRAAAGGRGGGRRRRGRRRRVRARLRPRPDPVRGRCSRPGADQHRDRQRSRSPSSTASSRAAAPPRRTAARARSPTLRPLR
jgi:hypothetical protein